MGLRYPSPHLKKNTRIPKTYKNGWFGKMRFLSFFIFGCLLFEGGGKSVVHRNHPNSTTAWFFLTLSPQSSKSFGGRATVRQSNEAKIMATTISFCRRKRVFLGWKKTKAAKKSSRMGLTRKTTGKKKRPELCGPRIFKGRKTQRSKFIK